MLHLFLVIKGRKSLLPATYSLPVLIPLSITCLWLFIQMIPGLGGDQFLSISLDPSMTQIMLIKTLALSFFSWLIFSYVNTRQRIYQLAVTIIISGFFQASYGAWLNLNPDMITPVFGMNYAPRANGTFIYHNQLANYLAQTLAIGIGILLSQLSMDGSGARLRHQFRDLAEIFLSVKMLIRLSLIIMIITLILTRSRMGNSAFFMALAATSIFAFFFYNRKPKNLRLLIISFFLLDLIIVGSLFGVEKVKQRLAETSLASETRDEVVRDSLPIIADYPLTGTGGGSFYSTFPSYHPEYYNMFYDHAHNDYIQFAVELGLPVALMLGLMLLYCLFISLKTMVKRKTRLYQGLGFGSAVAIIHMLLHSTVDFSLQSPAVAILFVSILSISLIAANLSHRAN